MRKAFQASFCLLFLLNALHGDARQLGRFTASDVASMSESTDPNHFVAVHGRRALVMGYPVNGLEVWAYPFQILSNYQIGFRAAGATAVREGRLLLREVDYRPDSVTRTYIGPDYLVREKLFVPLDESAVVITYQVEGTRDVDVEVRFVPVLNLMWPGALGGQYTRSIEQAGKSPAMPGFVIAEPERGYSAAIGSPQIISQDDTVNSTIRPDNSFGFLIHPAAQKPGYPSEARIYIALNPAGQKDASAALRTLPSRVPQLQQDAADHYAALGRNALRIRTPNEDVNRSLAWSIVALDQAWVCNSLLGCGLVAGYGPSRDARRPQYAWFFGGDGLVATNALLAAGEYSRAREELAFIQKYQDRVSGMIWHELSQSAGLIDWSKYPYMYVHVDISFDYLATLARYVAVTGDVQFAIERWDSIAAAFHYCQSQINSSDHLPHIPPDKEASDEQHRPADDLSLSASWLAAASGYAELAKSTGHAEQAAAAARQIELTRISIPEHYWNASKKFWFDGHTESGDPIFRQAVGPTQLLVQSLFPPQQSEAILNRLTSADFQVDWGTREVAASSKEYNPYSYGAGSISALGTAEVTTSLWQAHRPESALALWRGILQWNHLDSPGHIHEVLAGNFFHEETESVPEQTWSSAGFLETTIRGLLGLEVDGNTNSLQLAPHLPPDWPEVSVNNIRLPHSTLAVKVSEDANNLDLEIRNDGTAISMIFEPQIPLGAQLLSAEFNNVKLPATLDVFPGDEHVKVALRVPSGTSHCRLRFAGGVSFFLTPFTLQVGQASLQPKIVRVELQHQLLSIEADIRSGGNSSFRIRTPWRIASHRGVSVRSVARDEYELELSPEAPVIASTGYVPVRCQLAFLAEDTRLNRSN